MKSKTSLPVQADYLGLPSATNTSSAELVVISQPASRAAEAIQGVATELVTHHLAAGHRGIVMSAASRGVGLTFVASNLAVALAQRGIPVLLIDANLQHPGLHRLFHLQTHRQGLADLLRDPNLRLHDVVADSGVPNLSVVFSGQRSKEGHQDLLGAPQLSDIVNAAMRNFQFTIVDTSAANLSADARRVSTVIGYACIVVRNHETFVADVSTLLREYSEDGVKVVGTILNLS